MATVKPRFSVTFSDDCFTKIQKYQKENNIGTQSKAVARLVELAIGEIESDNSAKKEAPPYSSEALKLAKDFDCLDGHGKNLVRLVVKEEKIRCTRGFPYRLREAMGEMSVDDFAQKLGAPYKVQGLLEYLSGERIPREKALHDMSECLGVSSDWLCGLDEDKNKKPTPPTTLYIAARDGSRTETETEGKITLPEEDADTPE